MDLVAVDRLTESRRPHLPGDLDRVETVPNRQRLRTLHRSRGGAFHRSGVLDGLPQHLVAAADAEDRRAGRTVGEAFHGVGQARGSQPVEVGHRGFGAGEDDEIGPAQGRRAIHQPDPQPGLDGQRVEVGEVGDPRKADDGDVEGRARARRPPVAVATEALPEGKQVLGVDPEIVDPRQDAEGGNPGAALQVVGAVARMAGSPGIC